MDIFDRIRYFVEDHLANRSKMKILTGLSLLLGGSLIVVLLWQFAPWSKPVEEASVEALLTSKVEIEAEVNQAKEDKVKENWVVDVKGAVLKPGVYSASEGERVLDLIDRAGGFKAQADQKKLNLALRVADQMVIYVPIEGEEVPANYQMLSNAATASGKGDKVLVNINTADSQDLQSLSGIGEKRAADIISYREANGPFQSVEDLTKVSGFGPKTLEKLRDHITVN